MSYKVGVLKNFVKHTGKHLRQSLFFNKVANWGLQPNEKKILWCRCFPVQFAKFLRTNFLKNTPGRLLLMVHYFLACGVQRCSVWLKQKHRNISKWLSQNLWLSDIYKGYRKRSVAWNDLKDFWARYQHFTDMKYIGWKNCKIECINLKLRVRFDKHLTETRWKENIQEMARNENDEYMNCQ